MMRKIISKLIDRINLTEDEIIQAMNCIMDGEATQAQIAGFITALRMKGETVEEITGCARVMREKAEKISPNVGYFIDTCGTGGDGANTFNISTAAAFVAAAGGVPVAKHGNRSVSSRSGSADVLEALGVNISLAPEEVEKCIEDTGIGFLFAPSFHKSMKHAAGPRKELGIRTIFNLLGPLTNPAGAKGQVLGVFDGRMVEPLANVLLKLGVERAMVIHGLDGLDEITITEKTTVSEVKDGQVASYTISPEDFQMNVASIDQIRGGNGEENAGIIMDIFNGARNPGRDTVILNSAAALYIGKKAATLKEGVRMAAEIIDSGLAVKKVSQLAEYTKALERSIKGF